MLSDYLPIILLAGLVALFAGLSLAVSALLRPKRPTPAKLMPYECGIVPERDPRGDRFPVKFYVIAMLFIIFDIETIFLFPWAITFRELGLFGLLEMVVFIALVFVAYVYVRSKGGLDWQTAGLRDEAPFEEASTEATSARRDGHREVSRAG
jgi:NADH-quinone oxidoreductase subunit A